MKWMLLLSAMLVAGSAQAVTVKVVNSTDADLKTSLLLSNAQTGAPVVRVDNQILPQGHVFSKDLGQHESAESFVFHFELNLLNDLPVCLGRISAAANDTIQLVVEGHPGAAPANCTVSK